MANALNAFTGRAGATLRQFIIADTDSGKPSGTTTGDLCLAIDTLKLYTWSSGAWYLIDYPSNTNLFNARMVYTDATTITLIQYKGHYVEVYGELVDPGSSGLSCTPTDYLISSTGTDSGAGMGNSTLYYMYVSNSSASYASLSLRGSKTAPTLTSSGVYYLGTSGNALNWRFVGWVYLSSGNFYDAYTRRWVVNYYNRLPLLLRATPGYVDDDTTTTYTTTSATYVEANGGTGNRITFLANGEDCVEYHVSGLNTSSGAGYPAFTGVGEDQTTKAAVAAGDVDSGGSGYYTPVSLSNNYKPSQGYRYLALLIAQPFGGTGTWCADERRYGSTTDPLCTQLTAIIFG